MTMATINLLLGFDTILVTLGATLGALAFAVEGLASQQGRGWRLLGAIVLGYAAWGFGMSVGQDFARATDARLISHPADASSLIAVIIWTCVGACALLVEVSYWWNRRAPIARA